MVILSISKKVSTVEAMESSAFPDKIKIKWIKSKNTGGAAGGGQGGQLPPLILEIYVVNHQIT